MLWHRSGDDGARPQAARDVVELLCGLPQRRLDVPEVIGAPTASGKTAQADEPLSFAEAQARFAGLAWDAGVDGEIALLLSNGETRRRSGGGRMNGRVSEKPLSRRRPMAINQRPGQGGHMLRADHPGLDDVADGLEAFGQVAWRHASGGAWVGTIELDPAGNTVLMHRLSAYDADRGEKLVAQLRPNLALCQRFSELVPRLAIVAHNMSGTRDLRTSQLIPRPGEPERDDVAELLASVTAGWCKHAVWRDGDRIARDTLPGEALIRELQRAGIGMWLAGWGRKVDYERDRLTLRATMMVSAEERSNSTRRMRMGHVNRGPLAGKGWLYARKFGFRRTSDDDFEQDPAQTPYILRAFELADVGDFADKELAPWPEKAVPSPLSRSLPCCATPSTRPVSGRSTSSAFRPRSRRSR